jgi:hypothetical protein
MATYTVHLAPAPPAGDVAPQSIVFLQDGFSWAAFIFGPLWLAWKKAWIPAALVTIGMVVAALLARKLKLGDDAIVWINLAIGLALGFEGVRLVAWSLGRRGFQEKTLVIGDDRDEAEEVFFRRWRATGSPKSAAERHA